MLQNYSTRLVLAAAIAVWVAVATTDAAFSEDGVWVPHEDFAQINVFCQRIYECQTGQDLVIPGDKKIEKTSPETVHGVCSAGDGAADSCNVCLTNPPETQCVWQVVPK